MKETDEILRETLADERWDVPVPAGFMVNVETRVRRTKRRRNAVAVAAALVAIVAAIGIVHAPGAVSRPVTPPKPHKTPAKVTVIPKTPAMLGNKGDSALTGDALYVLEQNAESGKIYRLDRATHRRTVSPVLRMGPEFGLMLPTRSGLWVIVPQGFGDAAVSRELLRLDAVTLKVREHHTLPAAWRYEDFGVAGDVIMAATDKGIVRITPGRDGASDEVTPTDCRSSASLFGSDNAAGVLWVACGGGNKHVDLQAMDPRTGKIRGERSIDGARPLAMSGDGAGLWVLMRNGGLTHLMAAPGLPELPVDRISEAIKHLGDGNADQLSVLGARMFLPDDAEQSTKVRCLDTRTGAVLRTYELDGLAAVVSDGHELFGARDDRLVSIKGPDGCLS